MKGDAPEGVRRLGEEVEKLGRQRLVLKSDQEPSIKALLQSVKREKHQDISFDRRWLLLNLLKQLTGLNVDSILAVQS